MATGELTTYLITDRTHLVGYAGELVEPSARALAVEVRRLIDDGAREIVADLIDVTSVDSVALRALVDVGRYAGRMGTLLTVACDDPDVVRVLDLVGLRSLYAIEASVTDAFARVAARARPAEPVAT